jgi:hypothetical protein
VEPSDSELKSDPTSAFQTLPQTPQSPPFAFLAPPQTSDEIGRLVTNEAGRSAVDWDDEKTDDPVRATEEQIRSRLGPAAKFNR